MNGTMEKHLPLSVTIGFMFIINAIVMIVILHLVEPMGNYYLKHRPPKVDYVTDEVCLEYSNYCETPLTIEFVCTVEDDRVCDIYETAIMKDPRLFPALNEKARTTPDISAKMIPLGRLGTGLKMEWVSNLEGIHASGSPGFSFVGSGSLYGMSIRDHQRIIGDIFKELDKQKHHSGKRR